MPNAISQYRFVWLLRLDLFLAVYRNPYCDCYGNSGFLIGDESFLAHDATPIGLLFAARRLEGSKSHAEYECYTGHGFAQRQRSDNGAPRIVEGGGVIAVVCTDLLGSGFMV